ncbi:hypothetical protein [Albimonas pacifica]|uniref:Uncharacterized protein n=1 Tax=Albimonas pacifica TaxID=1114924 RepID=A0A1I3LI17_9RHOB|nr:hypothetical protein [Albimonas pacifica]SFI84411.1 hypothetical protein SAMN05216258_11040 [Albimonas pacifica]
MSKVLLYAGQPSDSLGTIVASADVTRTIDAATVCNPTASAATLTLHIVASGGTASAADKLYHELSVDAGATVPLTGLVNQCLARGATVQAVAGTASALTLTISGRTQG